MEVDKEPGMMRIGELYPGWADGVILGLELDVANPLLHAVLGPLVAVLHLLLVVLAKLS